MIGEYDAKGSLTQETVRLGDVPVAVLTLAGPLYVAPDHLGAPHQITNAAGQVVWSWAHDPFGVGDPSGPFTYNLRFPGQYFDRETKLNYNYFRDYDPRLGRYIESDPIGLAGGTNTYAYVGGNPVKYTDPRGTCFGPLVIYCTVEAITWGTIGVEVAFGYFTGYVNPTSVVAGEVSAAVGAVSSEAKCAAEAATPKVFANSSSITDFSGYPEGLPKPGGPFRLLEGSEYDAARSAANQANRAMHAADQTLEGLQLHEIQPVKFGGVARPNFAQ